jgi:hypothetical protein
MNFKLPDDVISWIIFIIISLFIGAIGTGLWESIIRPLITKTGNFFFKIITLGIKSAQNRIFTQIAKHSQHKPNLFLLYVLAFAFTVIIGYNFSAYTHSAEKKVQSEICSIIKESAAAKETPEQLTHRLDQFRKKAKEKYHLFLIIFASSASVFIIYLLIKYSIIYSAISFFDQCIAICGPYLKNDEEKQLLSDFALITSSEDFYRILNRLSSIAHENNKTIPPFSLF